MNEFWKRILDALQTEPPESAAWISPGVEEFTNDLKSLVLEKRQLAVQTLQRLDNALQVLRDAPEWEFYFHFSDIRDLKAHQFSFAAGSTIEASEMLAELLCRHRDLRMQNADPLDEESDLKRL